MPWEATMRFVGKNEGITVTMNISEVKEKPTAIVVISKANNDNVSFGPCEISSGNKLDETIKVAFANLYGYAQDHPEQSIINAAIAQAELSARKAGVIK